MIHNIDQCITDTAVMISRTRLWKRAIPLLDISPRTFPFIFGHSETCTLRLHGHITCTVGGRLAAAAVA